MWTDVWQPMLLTFSEVASNLGLFRSLAESSTPLTGTFLAESTKADPVLMST